MGKVLLPAVATINTGVLSIRSWYRYSYFLCCFRTYFVEYQFPVVAASRDQGERNTTATETVRAVSKKVEKSGGLYL